MLSSPFIHPVRMHTVYTEFRQIVSVDRDPSQCQQTIREFVSINRMGKQHSPVSIVHRSPANTTPLPHVCRRHSRRHHKALLALRACDGIMFRVVSFCNLIGSSKFKEVMVDRKYTEVLPGPFPNFSGGALGQGYTKLESLKNN